MIRSWGLTCIGLLGCASTTRAYSLKIDAADPARVELCRASSESATAPKCALYDGQKLETPAQLTVEVLHPEVESSYDLRVEHHYFPAQGEDARRMLGEVLKRGLGMVGGFVESMERPERDGGDPAGESAQAKSMLVEHIAALRPKLESWTLKRGEQLIGSPPPRKPRQDTDELFDRWIKNKAFADRSKEEADTLFGEPAFQPPPPRIARLNDGDVTYLAKAGIDEKALGAFVVSRCKPESFGRYAPRDLAWSKVPQSIVIDEKTVGKALLVDPNRIGSALRGSIDLDLSERIRKLNAEADEVVLQAEKGDRSKRPVPTQEAETIYVAMRLALLQKQTKNCIANLEFVARKDPTGSYAGVLTQVRDLNAATRSTAELFAHTIAPYILVAASEQLKGSLKGDRMTFGAVSVRPGTIELVATRDDGASKKQIAQLSLAAAPFSTIAIVLGPFGAICDDCYTQVKEGVQPGTGSAPAERVIREEHEAGRIGLAAAVHVSLWDLYRGQHHLGFMGGYPLAGGSATPEQLLLGLSYRHTVGVQLGLGAHLFLDQELDEGVPDVVQVNAPGNASLDAEAVSTRRPNAALFLMLGLTSDLFINQ